jgi:hypothetical protein
MAYRDAMTDVSYAAGASEPASPPGNTSDGHSLDIGLPAFTLKHHVDPLTTKARSVIGNLADAHPQTFLLFVFPRLVPA